MGRSFPMCIPTRNQSNNRHCHTFPTVSLSLAQPSPAVAKGALAATANVAAAKSWVYALPSPVAAQSTVAAPALSADAKSSPCPAKGPVAAPAQIAAAVQSPTLAKGPLAATAQRTVVASALAPASLPVAGSYRSPTILVSQHCRRPFCWTPVYRSKSCVCAIAAAPALPIPRYSHILLPPSSLPFGPQVPLPTCHPPSGPKRNATPRQGVGPTKAPKSTSSSCKPSSTT
jgi:hypothetical protein